LPPLVAASSGLDVLSHALESLTAMPFNQRPAPESPLLRPAYQGANPISDIWAAQAIQMVSRYIVRAVADSADDEARSQMLLASAGCICHTACRIRCRVWCVASSRTAIRQIIRLSRMACR